MNKLGSAILLLLLLLLAVVLFPFLGQYEMFCPCSTGVKVFNEYFCGGMCTENFSQNSNSSNMNSLNTSDQNGGQNLNSLNINNSNNLKPLYNVNGLANMNGGGVAGLTNIQNNDVSNM